MASCGVIYISYRSVDTLIMEIAIKTPLRDLIQSFRNWMQDLVPLSNWIIFNLPGALWILAFNQMLLGLRFPPSAIKNLSHTLLLIVLGIEVLQYFNITNGVFDPLDLLAYFLVYLLLVGSRKLSNKKVPLQATQAFNWKMILILSSFSGAIILSDLF